MDSKKILKLRKHIGWSQTKMARAMGCSVTTVSHWELGLKNPGRITTRFLKLLQSLNPAELKVIIKKIDSITSKELKK